MLMAQGRENNIEKKVISNKEEKGKDIACVAWCIVTNGVLF